MKKILLCILLISPLIFYGNTNVPPGPVSGHWDLAGSPYIVEGDIYIDETETLSIDPGVKILFNGWFKLEVFGSLMANGTSSSMITFSSNSHNTIPWHGIRIMETTAPSSLNYCIVENGYSNVGSHAIPDSYGGGILVYNSPNADIQIRNSIIRENEAYYGGGILSYRSTLLLENCEIKNNIAEQGGGVAMFNKSNTMLKGNKIIHNEATQGGGVLFQYCTFDQLECNIIADNSAVYGGGMYLTHSLAYLCKNTIARNTASEEGGGIYFNYNSSPQINSTIVYYNTDGNTGGAHQICLAHTSNDPEFNHCNIQGGMEGFTGVGSAINYSGAYENCVDGNPLFTDMYFGDYSLTWFNYPYDDNTKSICIDNGCPANDPDLDKSCCDIGACSYFQVLEVPDNLYGESVHPYIFTANWDRSYGALGYKIDVAHDRYFEEMIYDGHWIGTNSVKMILPELTDIIWLRVRSFNTGITSDNSSNYALLWVKLGENKAETPKIFSSTGTININIPQATILDGKAWVYNTSGQLLGHYSLVSGSNAINVGTTKQLVIVKVLLDNKVYQQKLLMH